MAKKLAVGVIAAGGAVLTAELLTQRGYIERK
jgi:hypothetical protein